MLINELKSVANQRRRRAAAIDMIKAFAVLLAFILFCCYILVLAAGCTPGSSPAPTGQYGCISGIAKSGKSVGTRRLITCGYYSDYIRMQGDINSYEYQNYLNLQFVAAADCEECQRRKY